MITLYDYLPSQNAYKVRLLLHHLDRPYETREIAIFQGHGQQQSFLDISPMSAVPAIRLEDGRTLAESNAILTFLAEGTPYLPSQAFARAKVTQWLCFETDYIQAGIATLRHWIQTGKKRSPELLEARRNLALKSLAALDRELSGRRFLVDDQYTVADMSVFAYTHRADEADLPLNDYAHVKRWIDRVTQQPRFLARTWPYSLDPHSVNEL